MPVMDLFDASSLLGGLWLFLFGMNVMGAALERTAGSKLEMILAKPTTKFTVIDTIFAPALFDRKYAAYADKYLNV